MIWTDSRGTIVYDAEPYISADGTTYPASWPKATIPDLTQVVEVPRPDETPAGWTVDGQARGGVTVAEAWTVTTIKGVPTQTWITTPRPDLSLDEAAAVTARDLAVTAQIALNKSDVTVLRCFEAEVALPPEWVTYRKTLRDILAGKSAGQLPARPNYPAGS